MLVASKQLPAKAIYDQLYQGLVVAVKSISKREFDSLRSQLSKMHAKVAELIPSEDRKLRSSYEDKQEEGKFALATIEPISFTITGEAPIEPAAESFAPTNY